jgi:acyl-CoA synthetase (AMP-forming)/AMP-acid ligase II
LNATRTTVIDRARSILFHDILDSTALKYPQKQAVIGLDGRVWNYEDLNRLIYRTANTLHDLGIRGGDHIALCSPNDVRCVAVIFAASWLGAVVAPLPHECAVNELTTLLNKTEARLVCAHPSVADKFDAILSKPAQPLLYAQDLIMFDSELELAGEDYHSFTQLIAEARTDRPAPCYVVPWEAACVMFVTSGTTGARKAVVHTFQSIEQAIFTMPKLPPGAARLPLFNSFAWVGGFTLGVALLTSGHTLLLQNGYNKDTFWPYCVAAHATVLFGSSNILRDLALLDQALVDKLQFDPANPKAGGIMLVQYGGSKTTPEEIYGATNRLPNAQFVQGYAQTECITSYSMLGPADHPKPGQQFSEAQQKRLTSAGQVSHGTVVTIVDRETGEELPTGEEHVGEICIRSLGLCRGYYSDTEKTLELFSGGVLHTGDLGYLDSDYYLYIKGRTKETITLDTCKVFPRDIEDKLQQFAPLKQAAIIGIPVSPTSLIEKIVAFVSWYDFAEAETELDNFKAHMAENLSAYQIPYRIISVDGGIPENANGKPMKVPMARFALSVDNSPEVTHVMRSDFV